MSSRKSTIFYGFLIAFASLVVGMVIASRLDLAPASFASGLTVPATDSAPITGTIDAGTFRNIAHDAGPAVVSIVVMMHETSQASDMEQFFGGQLPFGGSGNGQSPFGGGNGRRSQRSAPQQSEQVQGAGSGFIIDKAGYILTNNHVVENADSIEVYLSTMEENGDDGLPAKVVGRDPLSDTALIQLIDVPKEPLTEMKFGDSDQMAPGDWVMAIGNPFELSNTVTVGVVSATGRSEDTAITGRQQEMIQTDAAINRGNSGGPLLNLRGEVIGINTMIETENSPFSEGGNVGVGFAVPINTVRDLLPQLRQGKVVRGKIGVGIAPRPLSPGYAAELGLPNTNGAEVRSIEPNGAAQAGGMKLGDVIVEFNGKPVRNNSDLVRFVTSTAPGTTVPVRIYRDKKEMTLNVKVQELDLSQEAQANTPETGPAPTPTRPEPRDTGFGMSIEDLSALTPADRNQLQLPAGTVGAIVTDVTAFGPASRGGVEQGDVIVSVAGVAVRNAEEVARALAAVPAGRTVRVIVVRDGQQQLLGLTKR